MNARVRGAAGCRQYRLAASNFGDGIRNKFSERSRFGHEHAGVRRLPLEFEFYFSAGGFRCALFDQLFQQIERVFVVETDVEARARLAGDQVDGLVADVDRSELEVRGRKLRAALIERFALQRRNKRHEPADRVLGTLRVGDVSLLSA